MTNLRPLALDSAITQGVAPADWLTAQPDTVKAVTAITEEGTIVQRPVVESGAIVDPTAILMGGMIVKSGCYIGPYAVVRLDEKPDARPLIIGKDSNLQDGAVVHSTTQRIGERVIVAHQAIVHGAVVEDDVTIYIQAVVDGGGTVIGKGACLHQGSYVGKGIQIPEGRYIQPGQKVLTQADADSLGPVPDELKKMQNHVLELNMSHTQRYLKQFGNCL